MKILLFSTLYPNNEQPGHALFVEQRLLQLLNSGGIEARVVAPVPWFPFRRKGFGDYGAFARVAREERRNGVEVFHPRYLVIPKIGMSIAPFLMALGSWLALRRVKQSGFDFDLIDAHFLYPDGLAAVLLGQWFKRPVVITCRGSDVNLHLRYRIPLMLTRWIIKHASAVITVCEALKKELLRLSISSPPITVLRNGVDLQRFQPVDRILLRDKMELDGTVLVSVGRLATLKGHDLTIRALSYLPDTSLLLVGDGPERKRLEALAESLGVSKRVRFLGSQPQHRLKEYYSVGDISILSSSREGWANVLLESMACGTPVVATDVGGSREVIGNADVGRLASERTPEAIAEAVRLLLSDYPDRCTVRRYAEGLDWGATSAGQKTVFKDCLGAGDH